ncbi:MAG: GldG family protein [Planctomycetota bacterium]
MIGNRTKKRHQGAQTLLCVVLVVMNLLVLNYLSSRHFVRIDLTENSAYTLSPDTLRVLGTIDDLVSVKYFITHDLPPGYGEYRDRTEDLLEEFKVASRGRLQVHLLDPSGDSEARLEAENYGIAEVALEQRATESYEGKLAFMGLAVLYEDRYETIPLIYPDVLEYELLMRIVRVLQPKPPTIAFYETVEQIPSGMPDALRSLEAGEAERDRHSISSDYRMMADYLRKQYRLTTVSLKEPVPGYVDTLVVANEGNLDEGSLYYIDQFLMRGGKLALLIAGCEVDLEQYKARACKSVIDGWLEHHGIELGRNMVMDPYCSRVQFDGSGGFRVKPFPPCLAVTEDRIDAEHAITRGVKEMVIPFCGALSFRKPDGAEARILAKSSPDAWVMEEAFSLEPGKIRKPENAAPGPFGLMGILEGEFISYFSVQPVPDSIKAGIEGVIPALRIKSPHTAIFIAGSSDMIGNPIRMQEQNVYFATLKAFSNAIDYLTTGEGFWNIRAREQNVRYIKTEYRDHPETALTFKVAGTLAGALLVIGLGCGLFLLRRAGKRKEVRY